MKTMLLIFSLTAICLAGMVSTAAAADKNLGQVRHIVCFQYKEGTEKKAITEINRAFRALKGKIPGIVDFEMGVNNSPEGLNKGFSHCYVVTFENAAARQVYLPHPEHKKFVEILKPHLGDVFVIDYTL